MASNLMTIRGNDQVLHLSDDRIGHLHIIGKNSFEEWLIDCLKLYNNAVGARDGG